MSSIISKIKDDMEEYLYICEVFNVDPQEKNLYSHLEFLLESRGFKDKYELFRHLNREEFRDKKITEILSQ